MPLCRGAKLGTLVSYYPAPIADALEQLILQLADRYGMDLSRAAVFGPASEWLNDRLAVSTSMETAHPGLFVVGDGAGVTQGIVAAAVTGLRAVRAVRERC